MGVPQQHLMLCSYVCVCANWLHTVPTLLPSAWCSAGSQHHPQRAHGYALIERVQVCTSRASSVVVLLLQLFDMHIALCKKGCK